MEETLKALGDEDDPNKVDSPVVNAYRRFVEKWNPEKWMNNPVFEPFLETNTAQKVLSLNYIICVDEPECSFLHEDPALKNVGMRLSLNKDYWKSRIITASASRMEKHWFRLQVSIIR